MSVKEAIMGIQSNEVMLLPYVWFTNLQFLENEIFSRPKYDVQLLKLGMLASKSN